MGRTRQSAVYELLKKSQLTAREDKLKSREDQLRARVTALRDEGIILLQQCAILQGQVATATMEEKIDCSTAGTGAKLLQFIKGLQPNTDAISHQFEHPFPVSYVRFDTVGLQEPFNALFHQWKTKIEDTESGVQSDQERWRLPAVSAPPGTGKSHFLSVVASRGRGRWYHHDGKLKWEERRDKAFQSALDHVDDPTVREKLIGAVGIAITFNDHTTLKAGEDRKKVADCITQRLLYCHFHHDDWSTFCQTFISNVSNLTVEIALRMILNDIDKERSGKPCLIFAVDEVLKLTGDKLTGGNAKEGCLRMMGDFSPLYQDPRVLCVCTSLSAAVLPQTELGIYIEYFGIPLLEQKDVD